LVFAHPSKSRVKVLQSVGRLLRISKFGNEVNMFDLVDDFLIGAYENYTYSHGQKRVSFYNDQQFDNKIFNVNL
jgi:superfamily II DNA or RNA helicase